MILEKSTLGTWKLLVACLSSFIIYWICWKAWHVYYHPLAAFPGPRLAAISNFWHCYWFLGGRQPYKILELHDKFGPVVRTSPNELSFNTAQSWKDIYGFRQGHQPFIKSDFYDGGSFADQAHSIVSERDPSEHGKMRKYLSHAFSDRSLIEQEELIATVTDQFIGKIGERGAEGLDFSQEFEMMTFDIIGSLAFGENFGGVESGQRHPWITIVLGALNQGALADSFKRFPGIAWIFLKVMPGAIQRIIEDTKKNENYAIELIKKRIQRKTDRQDFMTRILEHRDPEDVSDIQLAAHSSDFVLAGSETTATALSCITYYLLRMPHIGKKLQKEVREGFQSYEEIDATSTAPLKYLKAVVLEGLRIYPPLPFALPRVVPNGGDTVDGHFLPKGTVVSNNPIAASLSSSNFSDPFVFNPDRWLDAGDADVLDATQPFSLGPRGCIGRSLAWVELRTTLAKLHYTYDLQMLDERLDWHKDSRMHTLWNKPSLRVRIVPRAKR